MFQISLGTIIESKGNIFSTNEDYSQNDNATAHIVDESCSVSTSTSYNK